MTGIDRDEGTVGRGRVAAALAALTVSAVACGPVVTLQLPALEPLDLTVRPPAQSFVYDADGNQLAILRREFREPIAIDDLPRHVLDAVVTAEDHRFWDHGGVDARAIVRAGLTNAAEGEASQGGSTITQQLIKTLWMPDEPRTPETKVREALQAFQLEDERSKREILELYLNSVYFGDGAHGIQAAARSWFGVDATDLSLPQAALLAVMIRSPESLDPREDPEPVQLRRDDVLRRMQAAGLVDAEVARAAIATAITVAPPPAAPETSEPHWVDLVVRTLTDDATFGETEAERVQRLYGDGLRVHTTLVPALQSAARTALLDRLPHADDPEAAIAVVDPSTGHLVAAAGNRSYDELQFDLATQTRRQAGSTFKTFVLAAAVTDGYHPDDRVNGNQGTIRLADGTRWRVHNYDRRSYGAVRLADATRSSVNASFARLGLELGAGRVAAMARAMGVRGDVPEDPQIAIGGGALGVSPLDLASAYGTLANLGEHVPVTVIDRIEDADGNVVWRPDTLSVPVLAPSVAYVVTEMLQGVVERGTGTAARIPGWEVAGKTGTTSSYADAWFAGYTTRYAAAVWVGQREGLVPLRGVAGVGRVTGGSIPARIWQQAMAAIHADLEPEDFRLPEEHLEVIEVDPRTGLRAAPWCPGEPTPLPRTLVPTETCPSPPPAPPPPPPPTGTPAPSTSAPSPAPSPTPTATTGPSPTPAPGPTPPPEPSPSPTAP